jgi:hypothetical protein
MRTRHVDSLQLSHTGPALHKAPLRAFTAVEQELCMIESDEQREIGVGRRCRDGSHVPMHVAQIERSFVPAGFRLPSCFRMNLLEGDTRSKRQASLPQETLGSQEA